MISHMLDTNIISYAIRQRSLDVRAAFKAHHGRMCISSITLMELACGLERQPAASALRASIEGLVARLDVMDFSESAAWHTGNIRAELAREGRQIGPYDGLIAGHARSLGLILVTNNLSEFERVAGLRLENWATR